MKFQSEPNTFAGEFFDLLENSGYRWPAKIEGATKQNGFLVPQGTTVLAFHFQGGVLVAVANGNANLTFAEVTEAARLVRSRREGDEGTVRNEQAEVAPVVHLHCLSTRVPYGLAQ